MANVNRKMNWRGVIKEMKDNWTRGSLHRHRREDGFNPKETHCALGAIGYANIAGFNELADHGQGYVALSRDPVTSEAVDRLAGKLLQRPGMIDRLLHYIGGPFGSLTQRRLLEGMDSQTIVLSINDEFGKDEIIAALEELQAEEEAKDKATEMPMEVEYHPVATEDEERVTNEATA